MLKIIASFSKKVPAEQEYSSQQYFCTLEREVPDSASVEQIQTHIHSTFEMVKQAVETELSGKKSDSADLRVLPAADAAPKAAATAKPGDDAKASNKQVRYILDLARNRGMGLSDVNALVKDRYDAASVYDIGKKSASRLVDELKAAA
jgi:hypothetical protein